MSIMGNVDRPRTVVMGGSKGYKTDDELDREIAELEAARNSGAGYKEPDSEDDDDDDQEEPEASASSVKPEQGGDNWQKRYSDLRRHSQDLQKELADLKKQLKGSTKKAMPKTKEELEEWKSKYQDAYDYVVTLVREEMESSGTVEDLDSIRSDLVRQKTINRLAKAHPDYEEVNSSPEWADWLASVSAKRRNIIVNEYEDADVLIEAISDFKRAKKWKKNKGGGSAIDDAPRGGGQGPKRTDNSVWSESRVASLSDAEYDKYADDIDKARREGTFVYDKRAPRF